MLGKLIDKAKEAYEHEDKAGKMRYGLTAAVVALGTLAMIKRRKHGDT